MPDISSLKEALAIHGPLYACLIVTDAFKRYTGEGVFSEEVGPAQHVNHAVLIVGWDDNMGAWLIKNSWSIHWGAKGYGWIKYGSNKIGTSAAWVRATSKAFSLEYSEALKSIAVSPED